MDLESLLVFNSSDVKNFKIKFTEIAECLLNNGKIVLTKFDGTKAKREIKLTFEIKEIEFYFRDQYHDDPFVHCSDEQKIPLNWYFHKRGGTFKEGSFKGLDITFGPKNTNSFGGILIRSMRETGKHKKGTIEGPCVCVNNILEFFGYDKVKNFVNDLDSLSLNSNKIKLVIENKDGDDLQNKNNVFQGPRVGLTLKQTDGEREKYLMKNYRFLSDPYISKYKNTVAYWLLHTQKHKLLNKYFNKTLISKLDDVDAFDLKNIKGCKYTSKDILQLYKLMIDKQNVD